jgi:hypothetical protein
MHDVQLGMVAENAGIVPTGISLFQHSEDDVLPFIRLPGGRSTDTDRLIEASYAFECLLLEEQRPFDLRRKDIVEGDGLRLSFETAVDVAPGFVGGAAADDIDPLALEEADDLFQELWRIGAVIVRKADQIALRLCETEVPRLAPRTFGTCRCFSGKEGESFRTELTSASSSFWSTMISSKSLCVWFSIVRMKFRTSSLRPSVDIINENFIFYSL